MTAGVKYYNAVKAIAEKQINFAADVFALVLSNTAPDIVNNKFLSDFVEIAGGNGYPSGGRILVQTSSLQAGGVYKTVFNDPIVIQAVGGAIGPFRYIGLVDQTIGGSPLSAAASLLLAYYDYGSALTLNVNETFTPDLDQINGLLQLL